jgi:hypothetical protein
MVAGESILARTGPFLRTELATMARKDVVSRGDADNNPSTRGTAWNWTTSPAR